MRPARADRHSPAAEMQQAPAHNPRRPLIQGARPRASGGPGSPGWDISPQYPGTGGTLRHVAAGKHGFQGYWSRRITDEHRLVYKVIDDEIRIAACRYHYERLPKPYSAMRCHAQLHNLGMPARDGPLSGTGRTIKCVVIVCTMGCRHTHIRSAVPCSASSVAAVAYSAASAMPTTWSCLNGPSAGRSWRCAATSITEPEQARPRLRRDDSAARPYGESWPPGKGRARLIPPDRTVREPFTLRRPCSATSRPRGPGRASAW